MFRKLLFTSSAVALLLSAITCVIWVRSYWVSDRIIDQRVDSARNTWEQFRVWSEYGTVAFSIGLREYGGPGRAEAFARRVQPTGLVHEKENASDNRSRSPFWERLGFSSNFESSRDVTVEGGCATSYRRVTVPYWAIVVPLSGLAMPGALAALRGRAARRRARAGRCIACGYDVRASPQRCPECGTPVEWRGSGVRE